MRPLPRLHAITDGSVVAREGFSIAAAAVASVGPPVALHARLRDAPVSQLVALTTRLLAHAGPPEASVFVNARADVARSLGAQGVQLGSRDLAPGDARRSSAGAPPVWIGRSVHSLDEARLGIDEGADYLLAGHLFETPTHPGRPGLGLNTLEAIVRLGIPVIAIGGITIERVAEVQRTGAWGLAAVRAIWEAPDAGAAALRLLAPWLAGESIA